MYSGHLFGQNNQQRDTIRVRKLDEVVVTATRTSKQLESVPVQVTRILASEIKNRGMVRLNELLPELTGLALVNDHGTGIQMQGFSPDYTLILLDGEPLIGRTSGTLELSRITTGNIDRIEIVKGPSSALYGSEAMAGVINIISARPPQGFNGGFSTRYGTNQTTDVSVNSSYKTERLTLSGFINSYGSNGYSLNINSPVKTVSPFLTYTFSGKAAYQLSDKTSVLISGRYYNDEQDARSLVSTRFITGNGNVSDFNIAPSVSHQFSDRVSSTLRLYQSTYKTNSLLSYEDNGLLYDQTFFNQTFNRAENQTDISISNKLKLTGGLGAQHETVFATRYDDKKAFTSGYGYFQADWSPLTKLNILAGGRYDMHSVYASQFSPKLAASYRFTEHFTLLGSIGRGYKAPDFRQLYLNFTNAQAGYSVFGYEEAAIKLVELQQQGQIQTVLINPVNLQSLNAESSTSYNFGFRWKPFLPVYFTANLFRNNVRNLIESSAIAIKTNGQSVFSYFNLNRIYTQGIETDAIISLKNNLEIGGGYQFMQAYDQDVLDRIASGTVFTRDAVNNESRVLRRSEYGGLYNRSRHMTNIRIGYTHTNSGVIASLRGIYRGRYGLGDSNGNGIVDADNEYVKGYTQVNASVSKLFLASRLRVQLTTENLFNYTNPTLISNLPGRLLYAGLSYSIQKAKP